MNSPQEYAPGLVIRGFTPPLSMGNFKLLAFGMDSAMLYPGAEELADACKAAGMEVQIAIGELSDGDAKLAMLQTSCAALGATTAQALVVGSSPNDIPMLRAAGLSAVYRGTSAVAECAMVHLQSGGFDRLLEVLTLHAVQEAPGLDLTVLDTLVGGDAAKFRKFANLFMSSVETVLAEVDTAIGKEDLETLAAMGHRAKSTALNIGAAEFSKQCLQMEKSARAQDLTGALTIARGLRPLFVTICAAIAQRLAG